MYTIVFIAHLTTFIIRQFGPPQQPVVQDEELQHEGETLLMGRLGYNHVDNHLFLRFSQL
ncbi:uncharacterized protein G2W53_000971 [Senna tora]|uniref:Uncharacterized protein n=1 Tax=Senna tora TaxID=362788 RepID=A0A835CJY3_9FABA|nr:uncharacterized protein G2W53_000971 [Senna tora]